MTLFARLRVIDGSQPLCYVVNLLECVSVLVVLVLINQSIGFVVETRRGVLCVWRIPADRFRASHRPGTYFRALISSRRARILVAVKSKSVARKWIDTLAVDTGTAIGAKSVYRGSHWIAGTGDFVGLIG